MGKVISISSDRRVEMDRTLPSAKSQKFPAGTVIEVVGMRAGTYEIDGKEVANDKLEVNVTGAGEAQNGKYLLPCREFLKAKTAEGSEPLYNEEGGNTHFPAQFKVVSSEDRKDREGKEVYPVQAYKGFEDMIEAGKGIDWNALVESGVKDDNELSPVQNYTFMIG